MPQVRVNKEQDHVLISPQGLSYAEVTGANLVSTARPVVMATHGKIDSDSWSYASDDTSFVCE